MDEKKRLQRLAGLLNESEKHGEEGVKDGGFTTFEFNNDLEVNTDNNELFKELEDTEDHPK